MLLESLESSEKIGYQEALMYRIIKSDNQREQHLKQIHSLCSDVFNYLCQHHQSTAEHSREVALGMYTFLPYVSAYQPVQITAPEAYACGIVHDWGKLEDLIL